MRDILKEITTAKRRVVEELKRTRPLDSFSDSLKDLPPSRFKEGLSQTGQVNVIAEIKKGSPSKGIMARRFDPARLAEQYRDGNACALSVLTEEDYFFGRSEFMAIAKFASGLPVLCKDFIIDRYQLYYAKLMKADAVLLITALHTEKSLTEFIGLATELQLDYLVEVHDEQELQIALSAGAEVVGVNNRNLSDFSVSLKTSERLGKGIPDDVIRVAESGIHAPDDIKRLKGCGYNCFLIGEALVTAEDPVRLLHLLRSA